ncbi:MAG: hypothetical protein IPF51_08035 [Dehalococcoidia bacterium]|uniref:hypothetical protein n=1 Tax=Candidatus Amarobacter glycogenicus TaxID=3140699 RepID=UPI0031347107|nr:hypothetical protein [Dehalococcoidia bacterium]
MLIPEPHEGFISFDTFQANQKRLRVNLRAPRGEAAGAVREGSALLHVNDHVYSPGA